MAFQIEIRCVNKTDRPNPWERIRRVSGVNPDGRRWHLSQEEAIRACDEGRYAFFVKRGGQRVDVIVALNRFGNQYLQTVADGDEPNNLLSLPECA